MGSALPTNWKHIGRLRGTDIDARLREHGFIIRSRRHGQEPLWTRGNEVYTQKQAVKVVQDEEKAEE